MSIEIGLPFLTCSRKLALTIDAVSLSVKRTVFGINARQRWQHKCVARRIPVNPLIDIIAVNFSAAHFSALIHMLRNRSASRTEVVREANNLSGICVPKWPLQGEVTIGRQTDNYWLIINREARGCGSTGKQPQVSDDDL